MALSGLGRQYGSLSDRYPDFTPYERQHVDILDLKGNQSKNSGGDFGKADGIAPKRKANYDANIWHHHQNGITMQEVPKKYIVDLHTKAVFRITKVIVVRGDSCWLFKRVQASVRVR